MAETTDISDKTWSDLYGTEDEDGAEYSILTGLAAERDGIDGRGSREAICVGLLAHDGRLEEIPDEFREEYADVIEKAQNAAIEEVVEGEEAEAPTTDDREPEEDEEEESDTGRDKKLGADSHKVTRAASFVIEAVVLQEWLHGIDVLVDECRIHQGYDSLEVRAVDAANVAMVDTPLKASAFDSYNVGDEGEFGVNLERLVDVAKSAPSDGLMNIDLDPERRDLIISWGSNGGTHEFTISLIDPDSIRKDPDLPDLDLPVHAEFEEAKVLYDAIGWGDDVSDHISFAYDDTDHVFEIVAEGDTDEYHGTFTDGEDVRVLQTGYAYSLFSLDYLKDIRRAWEQDEPIEVEIGEEFPCILRQDLVVDEATVGEAKYLLAPRIQSD